MIVPLTLARRGSAAPCLVVFTNPPIVQVRRSGTFLVLTHYRRYDSSRPICPTTRRDIPPALCKGARMDVRRGTPADNYLEKGQTTAGIFGYIV